MRSADFSPFEDVITSFEQRDRPASFSGTDVAGQYWYHGTNASFDQFKRHGIGIHLGSLEQARNAPRGRSRIIEAQLDIHNPLEMPDLYSWEAFDIVECLQQWFDLDCQDLILAINASLDGDDPALFERIISTIEQLGFDGIIYRNCMEGSGHSVIAFHPEQIQVLRTGAPADFA